MWSPGRADRWRVLESVVQEKGFRVDGRERGARAFRTSGEDYDRCMGRYSTRLAAARATSAAVGAITGELHLQCTE